MTEKVHTVAVPACVSAGVQRRVRAPVRAIPLVTALLLALGMACSCAAGAQSFGQVLRFPGKGTSGSGGSEFQLEGEEAHAFATDPATGRVYVGTESKLESEELLVQAYSATGAYEGKALIKNPLAPKGVEALEAYEGFGVDPDGERIYVLVNYKRAAEAPADPGKQAAGVLYALKSAPNGGRKLEPAEGTGKEGLFGSEETLEGNSNVQGKALLEPGGLAVNPKSGEVLVLGTIDEGEGDLHAAVDHVSSSGALLFQWVDPDEITSEEEPDSPVVTDGGTLLYQGGGQLFALSAEARSGAPEAVFSFTDPSGLQVGPFAEELLTLDEGTAYGGALAAFSEGSKGRLVAFASISSQSEAGKAVENRNGALELSYTEEAPGRVKVAEKGWTGGQPGEGVGGALAECEVGFANANPQVAAGSDGSIWELSPGWGEVIEFGAGGKGCPAAKEAPGGLEVTLAGRKVTKPETGAEVTLSAKVVGANVIGGEWVFSDGERSEPISVPSGEQTQEVETQHRFEKAGPVEVKAILRTDDLASPEESEKTEVEVKQAPGKAPSITESPKSASATEGETVQLKAAASGEPLPGVQWEVSKGSGQPWETIPGASSDELTLANVNVEESGYEYRAQFSNASGHAASAAAILTVSAAHHEQPSSGGGTTGNNENSNSSSSNTPPSQVSSSAPPAQEAAAHVSVASTSLVVATSGGVTVKLSCASGVQSCSGTVQLRTLSAVAASSHKGKKSVLTLAQGSFSIAGGHSKTVTLRLSGLARKLLSSSHALRARLIVDAHNASGNALSNQAIVTLHPAKRR